MKTFFFLLFSSLLFINAHTSIEEKNQTNSDNQHTFLVKTNLTKEEIELILNQHQNKEAQNTEEAKTNLNQKKEKSHKENKKEQKSDLEQQLNSNNTKNQNDNIQPSKISLNIVNEIKTNTNESDKFDTEDPPEPDLEGEKETSEISETSTENASAQKNNVQLLKNNKNDNEVKENVNLIKTNEAITYKGINIFNCFILILLTITFISVIIFVTQPKKSAKFYKDVHTELNDYILVKES